VLLENALVIQLWHYSEHAYFKGLSVLAATAVAYRQQLVWVHLLSCIHQLKVGGPSNHWKIIGLPGTYIMRAEH
jgi:hypothetical protein